ncbi:MULTISPECIES: hypothetical protein [Pirellulaceae]|nr:MULTISPECIES: hypothetical protein [Pirellulaceae]
MQQYRKWAARGRMVVWGLLALAVFYFNVRLYGTSPLVKEVDQVPPELVAQLAASRAALDAGSASQMQEHFPEGFYFSYLFHGLTWVELAMRDPTYTDQATDEAKLCLDKLNSAQGRRPFPVQLPPGHGMFYCAWKSSLRAGLVMVQQGSDVDQLALLQNECDAIAEAIETSQTPFLASYYGSAWPCDTVPAIHAMRVYDHVTGENRYDETIDHWLREASQRLDPETSLLPHTAELPSGQAVGVARATSQMIMLRLLPDIEPAFAKQQYEIFRERFQTTLLGAPCLLEYPTGISGSGDVDSGPLIFGRSLSATVLMMGIAQIYGDHSVADAIAVTGEAVGLPWTTHGQKQYAGGILPIGDLMVTYAHVARPWIAKQEHYPESMHHVSAWWRWSIHAVSTIVLLPAVVYLVCWRMRSAKGTNVEE